MASLSPSAEIQAAVNYLVAHLANLPLSAAEQASLAATLTSSLQVKYDSHWHPSDPERGSAYRALTCSSSVLDTVLVHALSHATSVKPKAAAKALAASMGSDRWTLWVDPGCVSIRMQGGATHFSAATPFDASSPSATTKKNVSGIVEIWGKLPSTVTAAVGGVLVQPLPRPKTPASKQLKHASSRMNINEDASVAAEFETLALNASPATKKSKAIAIMRPAAIHRGLASISSSDISAPVAATPPRPLPPLSFTIQESTSPYVPSFATAHAYADNASTSSGNTVTRAPTPSLLGSMISPPLSTSDSASSSSASSPSCASASDPFARPSSRSSTTSLNSATSSSIFSHASSDSRSSSIGSFTTEESTASSEDKENMAGNTTVTALGSNALVAKASKGEVEAAKCFTFPAGNGNGNNMLKADTLALLPQQSAPNSPSKPRRRHDRSASFASASSSSNGRPSSRELVVDKDAHKPQEYSNGKVGVLGGGVMLGPGPKKDGSNTNNSHKRNHSTASSSSLNVNRNSNRPAKVRTTSSGSITSNGSADHHHAHHHQQQHFNNQFYQQYQTQQHHQQNWSHYPAPPQVPLQYRY